MRKNNDKNKMNLPHPPSTTVAAFLIAEKLLSLWLWNFQTSKLVLLTFYEKLSVIEWVDYFVLQICLRWVEKKDLF